MAQAQPVRAEINLKGTTMDLLLLMAEGNPGAVSVLTQLMKANPDFLPFILTLDDMNIRGTQIWIGYKDYCHQDLAKFLNCVENRDEKMIESINKQGKMGNHPHVAVSSGASMGKRDFFQGA